MTTFSPASGHEEGSKKDLVKFIGERHRKWMVRHVVTGQRDAWRPKLVFRATAAKYLRLVDNQLRVSSCFGGLEHYRYVEGADRWDKAQWRVWPSLTIAADQGSDGVAALHAAMYKQSTACNLLAMSGVAQGHLAEGSAPVGDVSEPSTKHPMSDVFLHIVGVLVSRSLGDSGPLGQFQASSRIGPAPDALVRCRTRFVVAGRRFHFVPAAENTLDAAVPGRTTVRAWSEFVPARALVPKSWAAPLCQALWDFSHGAVNDLNQSYRKCGLMSFVLLLLIVENLPHGPDRDEGLRFSQMSEMMAFVFRNFEAHQCDLFRERAADILSEKEADLPSEVVHDADPVGALWGHVKGLAPFEKRGYKINTARFMAFQRAAYDLLKDWSLLLFKVEFLGLELDMVKGRAFKEKVLVKQGLLQEAAELNSTSREVLALDAKLLRSACQNAVVISMMVLGVPRHRRLLSIVTLVAQPVDEWHGKASATCRSVSDSRAFVASQAWFARAAMRR